MTVFTCKDDFLRLGMMEVKPSATHIAQDCAICTKPLAVHEKDASPKSRLRGYHDAVRINSCGHIHGKECLTLWLEVGNTCPTCNRILFDLTGDPITKRDISDLTYALGPMYGMARVTVALVRLMQKQEREYAALRRIHGQQVEQQNMKDANGFGFDERFLLSDEDLLDSDEEIEFEDDGEDDEDEAYLEEDAEED